LNCQSSGAGSAFSDTAAFSGCLKAPFEHASMNLQDIALDSERHYYRPVKAWLLAASPSQGQGMRKIFNGRRSKALMSGETCIVDSSKVQVESMTNLGLQREDNEDRFLVNALGDGRVLLVIADGMGGHAAGEVAAQLAVDSFEGFSPPNADIAVELGRRMEEAHNRILKHSQSDIYLRGMGTTLTALFISGASAFWAHVGDTRIYHFRKGSLTQITDDHTFPGRLLRNGEITREQARFHPYGNVLTRCVGCERHQSDSGQFHLSPGDLVLLSSDGLHDLIGDTEIADILSMEIPIRDKLDLMISQCLKAGGRDNITGVLASV